MPSFVVTITVDKDNVGHIFSTLSGNLMGGSISVWLRDEVDVYLRRRMEQRFTGEGDDVVGKWLPLASATEKIRAAKHFPPAHPINERTHYMRDWLTGYDGQIQATGVDVTLTQPGQVAAPLTQQKINTAQHGKSYPQTPPRPVIGVNSADSDWIQNSLVHYMFSGI